jgi:hypothetical protein
MKMHSKNHAMNRFFKEKDLDIIYSDVNFGVHKLPVFIKDPNFLLFEIKKMGELDWIGMRG